MSQRMTSKTRNPRKFRETGWLESLKERIFGARRDLDCVQVGVTSRCPGRCRYCPHTVYSKDWRALDLPLAAFRRLGPLMRRAGRVHLQGWGEPLLHPDFFEMAALARRAGCSVSTTTCGLVMDERIAAALVDSGLDIVAFSLAGVDPDSNEARTGVDFHRVCEAISRLQAVRRKRTGVHLELHIAYLMLASNMEAVRGLPALMRRLGVHAAVVSTLDYLPSPALEHERITWADAGTWNRALSILADTGAEARQYGLDFHYALVRPDATGTTCRENITRSLFISADGSASPCVFVNIPAKTTDPVRRVFGNVMEGDPAEIWSGEEFRRFRERLAEGDPDQSCRSCPKRFMV